MLATLLAPAILTANGADNVTLGDGTNVVSTLGGADVIHVGSGSNLVIAGGSTDQVFFAAHSAATVDTIQFDAASDSGLSLPDIVSGFNQATDQINILFAANGGLNYAKMARLLAPLRAFRDNRCFVHGGGCEGIDLWAL